MIWHVVNVLLGSLRGGRGTGSGSTGDTLLSEFPELFPETIGQIFFTAGKGVLRAVDFVDGLQISLGDLGRNRWGGCVP